MDGSDRRKRILVVDDEPGVRRLLELGLVDEGYDVEAISNGPDALARVRTSEPDLVLLDILMPQMDGFEVCRRIREFSQVPIILLTALNADDDVVTGLDVGADEYVTKPFTFAELGARMRAVLRRAVIAREVAPKRRIVCDDGRLIVDLDRRQAIRDGEPVSLTDTEFRLLSYLAANSDRAVPHEQILEHVWGSEHAEQTARLRTAIALLQRKIEADPQNPRHLLSVHGVGYRFECSPA